MSYSFKGSGSIIDHVYANNLAFSFCKSFDVGDRQGLADHAPLHADFLLGPVYSTKYTFYEIETMAGYLNFQKNLNPTGRLPQWILALVRQFMNKMLNQHFDFGMSMRNTI